MKTNLQDRVLPVMAGLDPANCPLSVVQAGITTACVWMAGSSPAMTGL